MGAFAGYIYFLYMIVQNKVKFSAILGACWFFFYGLKNLLSNTAYIETISPRNDIWDAVIASIMSQPKFFWIELV